jgi:DNA-binding PadR family transcriptional regulator
MMDIKYALLGFLSWQPATGYELKKLLTEAVGFYWSGNNNQVYTSLVALHREGLVKSEVQPQERYPARKVYTITAAGQAALRAWVLSAPEPPQLRKGFLVQLAWADQLSGTELDELVAEYEQAVALQLLMLREGARRGGVNPARTAREQFLWREISMNFVQGYETELAWVKRLRQGLAQKSYGGEG